MNDIEKLKKDAFNKGKLLGQQEGMVIMALVSGIMIAIICNQIPTEPPKANVVFENQNTICFQEEGMDIFCVDKTIKDTWYHKAP